MSSSIDNLAREYQRWNLEQGLSLGSADEHRYDENLTVAQRDWLHDFSRRWDEAAEAEEEARYAARAIVSEALLPIDDDMGTESYIKTIRCDTLLGIRRAVRELNRGSIPIYSDYDCTGLVCAQYCKFLKIYRCYSGYYVAVVELSVTRDV
jgi:hypothetical protein